MSEQLKPKGVISEETAAKLLAELLTKNEQPKAKSFAKSDRPDAIDLIALFWHLLSKWYIIAIAAVLSIIIGFIYVTQTYVPMYSATAKLYIIADTTLSNLTSALSAGTQLTNDYTEVFKTWEVHEMVREEIGEEFSYSELQDMLSVSNNGSSRVLYITVKSTDPELSSRIANAYSKAAKTFISNVMKTDEPSSFSMALVPSSPTGSGKASKLITFFLIGTLLAAGLLVLQFLLDDHPKGPEDITAISTLPVLGVIPTYKTGEHKAYGGSK